MKKLSIDKIISNISKEIPFEAVVEDYSFTIEIREYVPYICAAVHNGHQFRKSLWTNYLHLEYDRWYEEDPCTKEMIQSHPIVIAGRDSRFEYDLNRDPKNAIYDDAWGKILWAEPMSPQDRKLGLAKHHAFYKVTDCLVQQLEKKYNKAIIFDMHSFNWKRWDRRVPTWNLGTSNINNERFGSIAESWSKKLAKINLPNGLESTSKINDTFQGNGYFLKHITEKFNNTLVLATEIAKIYCDEETGIVYPEVVCSVEYHLKELIPMQVEEFIQYNS